MGFLILHRESFERWILKCAGLGLSHSGTMSDGDKVPCTEISGEAQPFLRGCCVPGIRLNAVTYVVRPV